MSSHAEITSFSIFSLLGARVISLQEHENAYKLSVLRRPKLKPIKSKKIKYSLAKMSARNGPECGQWGAIWQIRNYKSALSNPFFVELSEIFNVVTMTPAPIKPNSAIYKIALVNFAYYITEGEPGIQY